MYSPVFAFFTCNPILSASGSFAITISAPTSLASFNASSNDAGSSGFG